MAAARAPSEGVGAGGGSILPAAVERFFLQMGRFVQMLGRVFAWTLRPPYDWRELLRQMGQVGVASTPAGLLTPPFTGMGLALPTFVLPTRLNHPTSVCSPVPPPYSLYPP